MCRITYRVVAQLVLMVLLMSTVCAGDYDHLFRKYSKRYFSVAYDWAWFKAQAMAESGLNPDAVSPVGAKGLMQVMPATFLEIAGKTGIPDYPFTPRWNIAAGIFYDRYLYDNWSSPRPEKDRLALMFASYNAGLGNVLNAQRICEWEQSNGNKEDCNLWASIKDRAPRVHTWKHVETLSYVERIFQYRENIRWRK